MKHFWKRISESIRINERSMPNQNKNKENEVPFVRYQQRRPAPAPSSRRLVHVRLKACTRVPGGFGRKKIRTCFYIDNNKNKNENT